MVHDENPYFYDIKWNIFSCILLSISKNLHPLKEFYYLFSFIMFKDLLIYVKVENSIWFPTLLEIPTHRSHFLAAFLSPLAETKA